MKTNKKAENVFIVIPAFNEENNIAGVIDDLTKKYKNIIVVDDCSTDKTIEFLENKNIILLRNIINRGQGASLDIGTKKAISLGATIVVHFDADGQFLGSEIKDLIEPILNNEADIVIGSRFLGKDQNLPFFKKYFIMPLARFILKVLYGATLSDPQNGFRAMNAKVAQNLNIENDGAAHCTEIITKVLKNNWILKEVPVTIEYNDFGQGIFGGKGRGTGGIRILIDLFYNKLIN